MACALGGIPTPKGPCQGELQTELDERTNQRRQPRHARSLGLPDSPLDFKCKSVVKRGAAAGNQPIIKKGKKAIFTCFPEKAGLMCLYVNQTPQFKLNKRISLGGSSLKALYFAR